MLVTVRRERCLVCGGGTVRSFAELDHRRLVRCAACGLRFAQEYDPAALLESYQRDYYPSAADPRLQQWLDTNRAVWEGVCDTLDRLCPAPATLLDIGAGTGGFLLAYRARHADVRLAAVESSPAAREWLTAHLPGLVWEGEDADRLAAAGEAYGAVTLLQTLEHVADPAALCRTVRGRLRPGGVFLVTVPNCRSYRVRLRGVRDVYCYNHPTHLQFFDSGTLERLLRGAGFARVRRLVEFGGSGRRGPAALAQWGLRRLGLSSELRVAAWA